MQIQQTELILYVKDQTISRNFFSAILRKEPCLDVPGMTSFSLSNNLKLGLMPNEGIAKILEDKMPHPEKGTGIPRCELYLYVEDPEKEFRQAVQAGAHIISPPSERNWGDVACYLSDPDGHVIAFAKHAR